MKAIYVIITLIAMFFSNSNCFSQSELTRNGNTFKVEKTSSSYRKTTYTYIDSKNVSYTIYISKKGVYFVFKKSQKTGKEYKYYLPETHQKLIKEAIEENRNKK